MYVFRQKVFPLQLLGFDVDIVNSVHFSCHTGYPKKWEGDVLNGEQLTLILDGLERNGLLNDTGHLLTGYIGSESFLRSVLNVLKTLKSHNDKVRFVCDPVFGDDGKLYVPEALVDIYRKEVIPIANVCTPNQFEVEQLTGISIKTLDDAIRACIALHDLGPELVVITSLILSDNQNDKVITIFASERVTLEENGTTTTQDRLYCIDTPILKGSYTGTGDLFAALFLAWTAREPNNLPLALEKVVSTMHSVIKNTMGKYDGTVKSKELRLIQSKNVIEDPPLGIFKARKIL